jgi:hypothetical protein
LVLCIPWLFKYFFRKDIRAFAFWPLIVVRSKILQSDQRLLRHERIHLKQQMELLVIPFYVIYFIEFFVNLLKYREIQKAYLGISFEIEAFGNDADSNYLKHRKIWSMWRSQVG